MKREKKQTGMEQNEQGLNWEIITVKVSKHLKVLKNDFCYFRTDKTWGYFDKYSLETPEKEKHSFSCDLQKKNMLSFSDFSIYTWHIWHKLKLIQSSSKSRYHKSFWALQWHEGWRRNDQALFMSLIWSILTGQFKTQRVSCGTGKH